GVAQAVALGRFEPIARRPKLTKERTLPFRSSCDIHIPLHCFTSSLHSDLHLPYHPLPFLDVAPDDALKFFRRAARGVQPLSRQPPSHLLRPEHVRGLL